MRAALPHETLRIVERGGRASEGSVQLIVSRRTQTGEEFLGANRLPRC